MRVNYRNLSILILATVALLAGGWYLINLFVLAPKIQNVATESSQVQTATSSEQIEQNLKTIKLLTQSPISKATRNLFNMLNATTSKVREQIIKKPPFNDVSGLLTDPILKSKFVVINGSEIPHVGAQIFFIFVDKPDVAFHASFQEVNSTTTPFILVNFEQSADSSQDVAHYFENLRPYITEEGMTQ